MPVIGPDMTNLRRLYRLTLFLVALHACRVLVLEPAHLQAVGAAALSSHSSPAPQHDQNVCPLCTGIHAEPAQPLVVLRADGTASRAITLPTCSRPDPGQERRSPSRAPPALAV